MASRLRLHFTFFTIPFRCTPLLSAGAHYRAQNPIQPRYPGPGPALLIAAASPLTHLAPYIPHTDPPHRSPNLPRPAKKRACAEKRASTAPRPPVSTAFLLVAGQQTRPRKVLCTSPRGAAMLRRSQRLTSTTSPPSCAYWKYGRMPAHQWPPCVVYQHVCASPRSATLGVPPGP